jgi:uncharacterized membrane protein YbhN (UPF0104 family)
MATDPDEDPRPSLSGRRKLLAQASTALGVLIVLVAFGFIVREVAADWDEVREALAEASWGWVALAFVLAALGMASIGWTWPDVFALLGVSVPRLRAVGWYFVGELGKYLPGGVWPVVGRGEMARRGGIPRSPAYASVALSLITLYLGAMVAAVALLPFAMGDDGPGSWGFVLLLLPLGLAALHPAVLRPVVRLARRVTRRELVITIPLWHHTVGVVLRYVPTWVFIGASTTCVAKAIAPDASIPRLLFATVLSWIAGFVVIFAPGGAGVREAVFTATCGLPYELGATVALISRLQFVLVDAGGAALSTPLLRRGHPVVRHVGGVDVDLDGVPDVDLEGRPLTAAGDGVETA